jgi:fibronectin type 3 domain-containing protein
MLQRVRLFDGVEKKIEVYNGQAILDYAIEYFTRDDCDDESEFTFPSYLSSYFRIYNERLGREIKEIVLSNSGGSLIVNASALDMTFDDNGTYYYEIGYVQAGGYEIALQFGPLRVI